MKKIFFTPGPTELYPTVLHHIDKASQDNICSISHRSETFKRLYSLTIESLKSLLCIPENFQVFFLSSATESMERIIENCVAVHSHHFVNGAFSKRFFEIARSLKKLPTKIEVEFGKGLDLQNFNVPQTAELICFTQNETSSGVAVSMDDIYEIKKIYPNILIAVDVVSSVPYTKIDFDYVDCAFFSVQKGFGLPSGLGILVVNELCIEKARMLENNNINIGSYHNFPNLFAQAKKYQTYETPNVLGIFLLGRVCEDYLRIGIDTIIKETEKKASLLYEFFDQHSKYCPFVKIKADRSNTVIVIDTPGGSQRIIARLMEKGFVVGTGYGKDYRDKQIRIANFPMHMVEDIERMLSFLSDVTLRS